MANPNFSAILDDDPADAEAPKGLPAGQYVFLVNGQPKFDKSTKKGTDYVEFTCKPLQPFNESVDQDAPTGLRKLTLGREEDSVEGLDGLQDGNGADNLSFARRELLVLGDGLLGLRVDLRRRRGSDGRDE